jgi:predicted DNA binding protein
MRSASIIIRIPDNLFGKISTSGDLSIQVLRCETMGQNGGRSLIEIDAPSEIDGECLAEIIREAEPSCEVNITPQGKQQHLASIVNNNCGVCAVVAEAGCFLESARSNGDGRMLWRIIAPSSTALQELVKRLRSIGCELEITRVSEHGAKKDMTSRQEQIVQLAFKLGYYDIPRHITLQELAERVGTCKSSLDLILRRAERMLICEHLGSI